MIELPNITAETLGLGGTVKFRSSCPIIVSQVGVGNVATLTGTDTFEATEVGEYMFENTCDCVGFYAVTSVGDMSGGCCVAPITDATGNLEGITIAGIDYPIAGNDTTYTFPATVADDGVMVVTDSDGVDQTVTIEFPEDVDVVSNAVVGGVVVFSDSNGDPIPALNIDLNPFVSDPHPTIAASGDATATFDATANEWTIGFVDTDTDTTYSIVAGQLVGSDGTSVPLGLSDTNISAVTLSNNGLNLRVTATEDGSTVTGDMVIPDEVLRDCEDKALIYDADLGWVWKPIKPDAYTFDRSAISAFSSVSGAAVDALVGQTVFTQTLTIPPFVENTDCYSEVIRRHVRVHGVRFQMGNAGDRWTMQFLLGADYHLIGNNTISHQNNGNGLAYHEFAPVAGSDERYIAAGVTSTTTFNSRFNPLIYNPHASNILSLGVMHQIGFRYQVTTGGF